MKRILIGAFALVMVLLTGCDNNAEVMNRIDELDAVISELVAQNEDLSRINYELQAGVDEDEAVEVFAGEEADVVEEKFVVDEETYRLGIQALRVIDNFLDGRMPSESAHLFLSRFNRQIREVELTHPQQSMNNNSIYSRINTTIFMLEPAVEGNEQALENIFAIRRYIAEFLEQRNIPVMTELPINEATYSLGVQALEVIDRFFNGDISVDDMQLTLRELLEQARGFDPSDRLERTIHVDVRTQITFISLNAGRINESLCEGSQTYIGEIGLNGIFESRNNLAVLLGRTPLSEMPQISDLILE